MIIIILPVIGLAVLSTLIVWSCCIIAAESDEREMELWDEYESKIKNGEMGSGKEDL